MNRLALFASVGSLGIASESSGQTVTYSTTGHTVFIPNLGNISFDFVVTDPAVFTDIDVGLIITHTWQGGLSATLEHVGFGAPVTILNRPGGTGPGGFGFSTDNYGNLVTGQYFVLDDEAPSIYDTPFVPAPGIMNVTGHWKPDGPPAEGISSLGVFDGQPISGTWRLKVSDHQTSDVGAFRAMQLTFTIPGPVSLGPLFLGAMFWSRRQRRESRSTLSCPVFLVTR